MKSEPELLFLHGDHPGDEWPDRPTTVCAAQTLRTGGVSQPPYDSLNMGAHVGDDRAAVDANRQLVSDCLSLPAEPRWLNQVHGVEVARCTADGSVAPTADAAYTDQADVALVILTADCLPVLVSSLDGGEIGAAHAGWRSLCGGVLENLIQSFRASPDQLTVWLGPAIGPDTFEVGPEVRTAFIREQAKSADAFRRGHADRWLADIYQLARLRLSGAGVHRVHGGGECTVAQAERYFSYRRDGTTGRMATLIWCQQ